MADYDNITVGQLVETTAHINGWQRLRRLLIGGGRLDALADGAELGPKIGTYTGDGAATKAITGVGFQPRFVILYAQVDGSADVAHKSTSDGTKARYSAGQYEDDHIISFGADGFTVGDGTGGSSGNVYNVNLRVYTYIAYR